jgi:glycosyltransferase involved in cell wall biosynthesis
MSGKRLRTLNLITRLAKRHRITYICHRNADEDEARVASVYFRSQGIETIVVDRAVPSKSGPAFYARLAANLASPLPYSVASHSSRALREAVQRHAASNHVDLWQVEWTPYAEALRGLKDKRHLIVAHNVESMIWERYHETETNALKRWYIGHQWKKFERFEKHAFAEADGVVAVSSPDAEIIRGRFGATRVDVVDNGVNTAYFERTPDAERQGGQILFLGSLDWRPNLDAVELLLDRIYPAVRAAEPSARLVIVGRNPPAWLVGRAAAAAGVEVHGSVPDVRPFMASSAIMAVPLRIGGGSRLKILEALSTGLPVVSTRVGAEGLDLEPGRDLTVVEEIDRVAIALVDALRNPREAREKAERGRGVVLSRYDWDTLADALERSWVRCVEGKLDSRREEGRP